MPSVRWRLVGQAALLLASAEQFTTAFIKPPQHSIQRRLIQPPQASSWTAGDVPAAMEEGAQSSLAEQLHEKMQHHVSAEELLAFASHHADSLSPVQLSQAVLHLGRSLVQPVHTDRRQRLREHNRFEKLLSAWHTLDHGSSGQGPTHHADLLLGLTMLDYKLPDYLLQSIVKVLQEDHPACCPEHMGSDVAWALQRVGRPELLPQHLQDAVDALPFRVRQGLLSDFHFDLNMLRDEVAFTQMKVMNVDGKDVSESRYTAWQGPRSCFHNGRELKPSAMTPIVSKIRELLHRRTGVWFDCVFLNYYKDGRVGKGYHSDTDQGELWTDKTAIVSIGDPRFFCLRRRTRQRHHPHHHADRHRFLVSDGDVVLMFNDCQEQFQHCVEREDEADDAGPRISLVFKQSLVTIPNRRKQKDHGRD